MIDKSWTLFLDRDGVINRRIVGGYVTKREDFEFLPGVPEAIKIFSSLFSRIIIVSNQQGIGKGLMSEQDLKAVHEKMISGIENAGGRIDAVYHCPSLAAENSILRKPNIGMALRARKEFPEIRFKSSVMAGDSSGDMIFGRRLGMTTVFLCSDIKEIRKNARLIDFSFRDLPSFAELLTKSKK